MASKVQRQQTIVTLIGRHAVTNQPQLVELLAAEGIAATQATVPRDLDDLDAVKVRVPGGETVYAIPEYEPARIAPEDQLRRVMGEWVAEVRRSGNLIILRTPRAAPTSSARPSTGRGSTALIGTVAGDDTLLSWPRRTSAVRSWPPGSRNWPGSHERAKRANQWDGASRSLAHLGLRRPPPSDGTPMSTLWHGRFEGGPSEELLAFTVSLPFDQLMWREDIIGSRADVRGLAHVGLLERCGTRRRARRTRPGRGRAGRRRRSSSSRATRTSTRRSSGPSPRSPVPPGAKLHTGRSRNDQVATDVRLWCKTALARRGPPRRRPAGRAPASAPCDAGDTYLPGYTHLQRAQPVLLAHHLLAYCWALARDVDRLAAPIERLDVSPLGAGALAGSSLPLDPAFTAAELGFDRPFDNSLDAVSDRDFVAEFVFDLALIGIHLSRLGEEWVLWTSDEFGFARLDDAFATGSSILPQKKNPDVAELIRGKTGRLIGDLHGSPRDGEGPAAGVQPRPAGGQGAAVRLGPPGVARPVGDGRDDRHGDVPARADADRGRRRVHLGDRPRRVAGRAGHAVP